MNTSLPLTRATTKEALRYTSFLAEAFFFFFLNDGKLLDPQSSGKTGQFFFFFIEILVVYLTKLGRGKNFSTGIYY